MPGRPSLLIPPQGTYFFFSFGPCTARFLFFFMAVDFPARQGGRQPPLAKAAPHIPLSSITCALIRFVDPLFPRGTPAVMTTVSPGRTSPSFTATSAEREKIRSVELTSPVRKGVTPQQIASCRRVFSCMVSAATGQAGRKRQIIRAVRPELLAASIAVAFKSRAVRQQVWVMASLMLLEAVTTSCFWKRFQ